MQITAKWNYPGSVASYDTRPGNEVGLFYNAHEQNNSAIFASRWQNYTTTAKYST